MAQQDNNWIMQIVAANPAIQVGVGIGIGSALIYAGYKRFFGDNVDSEKKDANEKIHIAFDGMSKLIDAQARLIELQRQEREGLLDETHVTKSKTKPISNETLDQLNQE